MTKLNREITKEIKVNVKELDQALPQQYYDLVGKDLKGKTWVFDGKPGEGKQWWYMCPSGDSSKWQELWWNAGDGADTAPVDASGKMVFDLNGGANYTYYASADAAPVKGGTFSFNGDFSKFYIGGPNKILGNTADRGNAAGEYQIVKLTEDKLILYVPTNAGGTGWCWVFKPEE